MVVVALLVGSPGASCVSSPPAPCELDAGAAVPDGLILYSSLTGAFEHVFTPDPSDRSLGAADQRRSNLPQYSPDGSRIVLGSTKGGNMQLWVMDAPLRLRFTESSPGARTTYLFEVSSGPTATVVSAAQTMGGLTARAMRPVMQGVAEKAVVRWLDALRTHVEPSPDDAD